MKEYPIIASVTDLSKVDSVIKSKVQRVNLVTGDICVLKDLVIKVQNSGKKAFVHMEMINGVGRDSIAIKYLHENFNIDGIISTRGNNISAAKALGLAATLRIFAIDTTAVESAIKIINKTMPDQVELMPGLMPKVIKYVKSRIRQPIIVGGLIRSEEEVKQAIHSGADYVSTAGVQLW
ncbi:glycerol-3-phosphate responsive antiterminator [Clostridium arbusti]|uniref:glycerol-3-phosphate responsive antiterminator n=1 Tax=Clostridium arbusti TaxID=1137848 RepID=UPI0002891E6F|nr:glycerol-3-phosphate responsive antiterminator [Clostridium arbusti]